MTHRKDAVVHATHWKAGSQWVYQVLSDAVSDRIAYVDFEFKHLTPERAREGAVFSPVYLTAAELDERLDGVPARRFFVMRDLRDALVSLYYYVMHSYTPQATGVDDVVLPRRTRLSAMTQEEGLLTLIDEAMPNFSRVQRGWLDVDALLIRYEDLTARPDETFGRIFDYCGFDLAPDTQREVILRHSFEKKAGRPRGVEDVGSHYRKGVAGDWRRHFTPRVTEKFRHLYGEHLIATGYESNLAWSGTAQETAGV